MARHIIENDLSAATEKATPVIADTLVIADSEASNALKRVQVGNLPSSGGEANQNAFSNITDGTNTAAADTETDTFKIRSANSLLTAVVSNDDATHGDSVLFTVDNDLNNYDNTTSAFLKNVVEDTTPQLGGELDAQGNNIIDLADVTFKTGATGGTLRTGTSDADKFELQAYDVNDSVYRKVLEVDAGNDPQLEVFADSFAIWDNTDETKQLFFTLSGGTTGVTTEILHSPTANRVITFPDATDTLVGRATTDTLTNKTIDGDNNTVTNIGTSAIKDLNVTTAKLADGAVTQAKLADTAAWKEIGRTTLDSAGDTITVSGLPVYKHLMVVAHIVASGTADFAIRFNGDSGSNYGWRKIANDTQSTGGNDDEIFIITAGDRLAFTEAMIDNVDSTKEKFASIRSINSESGAGNSVNDVTVAGKWANTSDSITRIDFINSNTGDYAAGSQVVVLGRN